MDGYVYTATRYTTKAASCTGKVLAHFTEGTEKNKENKKCRVSGKIMSAANKTK